MAEVGKLKGQVGEILARGGGHPTGALREAARRAAMRRNGINRRDSGATSQASAPAPQKRFETPESLPQATIDNAKLNRAIGRAAHYTDINYHQGARRVLSRAFGYDDLTNEYSSIMREHERAGHLTSDLNDRVNEADKELFRRIRMQHGDGVLRRVYRGL